MTGVRLAAGVELGVATHAGRVRTENEDDYLVLSLPERGVLLLAVADGMGGLAGGADASRAAVRALGTVCAERAGEADGEELLRAGFDAAAARLRQIALGNARLAELGTTLTALLVVGERAWLGHVGDSRCLHVRRGLVEQLSVDHALEEPRHLLTRCLGAGQEGADGDFVSVEFRSGDVFVLLTDGAWSLLPVAEIGAQLRAASLQEACEALANAALERGAPDNVTILAARLDPSAGGSPHEVEVQNAELRPRSTAARRARSLVSARWPILLLLLALFVFALAWARWQSGFDVFALLKRWLTA